MLAASVLVVDISLLAALAAEGSVLARAGGTRYVLAPLAVLILHAIAVSAAARWRRLPWLAATVTVGALAGLLSGAMWIASLTIETFAGLSGWPNVAATAPLLLGAFVVWAAGGGLAPAGEEPNRLGSPGLVVVRSGAVLGGGRDASYRAR